MTLVLVVVVATSLIIYFGAVRPTLRRLGVLD
jgi:hypothetical protein